DHLIGADDLAGHVRNKLLRQQLRSIGQMTPALLVGSLVASVVFLTLTWGTARFAPLLICLTAIEALYLCAVLMARNTPEPGPSGVPPGAVLKTLCFAMALGGLWGAVLNILPVADSVLVRSAATIGVGGLLCISMMALVNYPQ